MTRDPECDAQTSQERVRKCRHDVRPCVFTYTTTKKAQVDALPGTRDDGPPQIYVYWSAIVSCDYGAECLCRAHHGQNKQTNKSSGKLESQQNV